MIQLLYGKNDFLLHLEKQRIKRDFLRKFPSSSVFSFDSQENNLADFFSLYRERDIFSQGKLIFSKIFSLFFQEKEVKEFFQKDFFEIKEDKNIFLVFLELAEKNEFINFCLREGIKNKFFKTFSEKDRNFLLKVIFGLAKEKGIEIGLPEANLLIDLIGYDGWQIKNELEKLITLSEGKKISQELIYNSCRFFYLSKEIFSLAEKIIGKNKKGASFLLAKLFYLGEDPAKIFNLLLKQIKNFSRIRFLPERELSFNRFYLKKIKSQTFSYSLADILKIYRQLSKEDIYLKTSLLTYQEALIDFLRTI